MTLGDDLLLLLLLFAHPFRHFSQPHINGFNFVSRTHNTGWLVGWSVSGEIPRVSSVPSHPIREKPFHGHLSCHPPPPQPLKDNTNTRRKVQDFLYINSRRLFFCREEVHASPVKVENRRQGKLTARASIHRASVLLLLEKGATAIFPRIATNRQTVAGR